LIGENDYLSPDLPERKFKIQDRTPEGLPLKKPDSGILQRLYNLDRRIRGRVIADDKLIIRRQLRENTLQLLPDETLAIIGSHTDRDHPSISIQMLRISRSKNRYFRMPVFMPALQTGS